MNNSLDTLANGLTSEVMADIVKNSQQSNFFMYVFIIFALIMVVGLITIVAIFLKKDSTKDTKQNEQYKNLIDSQSSQYKDLLSGYTKMIDQNSATNTEFRKTIADIGEVLRGLTTAITKNESQNTADNEKIDLMFQRIDSLSTEFKLHEQARSNKQNKIDESLQLLIQEMKQTTDWCKVNSIKKKKE